MKTRFLLFIFFLPHFIFAQVYSGDTLWTRDYSSTGAFSCAFSPDGSRLAVAYECMGPMVRVLDVNNGHILWESETPDLCLYGVQFSSNGQYIALAEELGHLMVFDMELLDTVYRIDTQSGGLNAVDFSPSGDKIYAGGNDGTIRIFETSTGTLLSTIYAHMDGVLSVDVSTDGRYLASGGKDMMVMVFDLETETSVYDFMEPTGHVKSVKFTPDGNRLLAGCEDQAIYVYRLADGTLDTTLYFHTAMVNVVDISVDGSFAVSGSNDQSAVMFNLYNYEELTSFTNQLQTRVYGLSISPDHTKLAVVNHIGYTILYNIETFIGLEEEQLPAYTVYPNPAREFLYYTPPAQTFYQLLNVSGQVVQSGTSSGTIVTGSLPKGIYFLRLNNSLQMKKIILQ